MACRLSHEVFAPLGLLLQIGARISAAHPLSPPAKTGSKQYHPTDLKPTHLIREPVRYSSSAQGSPSPRGAFFVYFVEQRKHRNSGFHRMPPRTSRISPRHAPAYDTCWDQREVSGNGTRRLGSWFAPSNHDSTWRASRNIVCVESALRSPLNGFGTGMQIHWSGCVELPAKAH